MFGMRVEGTANMYVENELVVKSVTMNESRLKKKHLSICYHAVCAAVAGGKLWIVWVPTGRNIADLLTMVLEGPKIYDIVSNIIH